MINVTVLVDEVAGELEALRDQGAWALPCPQCEAGPGRRCRQDWDSTVEIGWVHKRRLMMYVGRKRRLTSYRLPRLVEALRPRLRPSTAKRLELSISRWAWAEAVVLIAADLTNTGSVVTPGEHDELLLLADMSDVTDADRQVVHAVHVSPGESPGESPGQSSGENRPLGEPGC